MNMFSRCNKSASCDANETDAVCHGPCERDVHGVNRVAEILSNSLLVQIPQDSTEVEDSVTDEAENVELTTYSSSSSPGSASHCEEWSDEGCKEGGLALTSAGSTKAGDSAQEASCLDLPSLMVVSALKGSREKQGIACTKLSFSWSPDVYDPIPTIVSHTVKNKQKRQSKSEKKSGKSKHKGSKASKQYAGKDKKPTPKYSGSAKNCYTYLDAHDRLVEFDDQSVNFDVGSPEFCTSSFLKASHIRIQMPAMEALKGSIF